MSRFGVAVADLRDPTGFKRTLLSDAVLLPGHSRINAFSNHLAAAGTWPSPALVTNCSRR